MADISEFNINNTLYNLKDTQARNDIESISSNLNNYLPLSGGTLTGSLTTSLQLVIKDDTIDTSISPESNMWPRHIIIKDKDDEDRGHLELYSLPSSVQGIQLETKRIVNNTSIYNGIKLGIDSEGNRTISLHESENWRNALGATNGIWPIELGGTGATSKTTAIKNLFQSNVGTSTTHVLSIYSDWSKAGYISVQALRNQMGLGNTVGVLPTANGGTGTNSLTTAVKNFTNDNISTSTNYFLTITTSWARVGYCIVSDAWKVLSGNTTNGILPISKGGIGVTTATANRVFAAPNGSNGTPSFRALVAEDLPSHTHSYLPLSGGTVTNSIYIKEDNYDISTSGTVSAATDRGFFVRDKNSRNLAYFIGRQATNGDVTLMINARRYNSANVNNYIYLKVTNNGTKSVELSDPEAWRNALELNDSGWLSLTNADATTGFSGTIYYRKIGKLVQVKAYQIKLKKALSSDVTIQSVPSGYRPPTTIATWGGSKDYYPTLVLIGTGGNIHLYNTQGNANYPANTNFNFSVMYLLD